MGHYSVLYIDKLYFAWKYHIPTFLTFLFDKADFYDGRDREEEYEGLGYKTTVSRSLQVLDKYGYTMNFFAEVYSIFFDRLNSNYAESAKEHIAEDSNYKLSERQIQQKFAKHIGRFPSISRVNELCDFVQFLRALMLIDFSATPCDKRYQLKLQDGKTYLIDAREYLAHNTRGDMRLVDFESLQIYLVDKTLKFPPWILTLCGLFDEGFINEYPEIISLMFLRCALEAADEECEVRLELSDIVEEREEAENLHLQLAHSLVEKVNLYNKVFQCLFTEEAGIREAYIRTECRELLSTCEQENSKYQKGLVLEHLMELLFTSNNHLELVDKRVSTGDEEIDLIIKNNIGRPFWMAFNSPLFFVECKNWHKPVGSKEIRDFETKMRNHSKLAKLGFFVSYNGFTAEALEELKRAGREDYHIVLIKKANLLEYLQSGKPFFEWLENLLIQLH